MRHCICTSFAVMILATGCGGVVADPADLAPLPDLGSLDMAPDATPDATPDLGPDMVAGPLALCDPEPADWPARPRWGELTGGAPDYQNVMDNFNVLDSLRLLASILDKAVQGINAVTAVADQDATGPCVCNCNAFGVVDWSGMPANPGKLQDWADAQSMAFEMQCFEEDMTREACATKCDMVSAPNFSPGPINTDKNFIWAPSDVLVKPDLSPKYALKLIDFLDEVTGFLSTGGTCMMDADCDDEGAVCDGGTCKSGLRQVLDTLSMAGANLTMEVQMVIDSLANVFAQINRFTEGYHLGGYSTQRPRLHMCVGWAGHGAYAQMGELGGDRFSIGARYTSHQLSYKRRAQFRSGGFGVQAFGKALSVLPTPEANLQIDGFKMWNSDKPFGLNIPAGGIPVTGLEDVDIFHLVDAGQVADLAGSDGDPSSISIGELLITNYFPAAYTSAADMMSYVWPRSQDAAPKPWLPWTGYDQEARSTAVFSAGLNLPLAIEPIEKTLPPIPIFPPYASLEPYFRLAAGVEWIHEAFRLRTRLQDMINENLPAAEALTAADFAREMHALQAPDVTEDNGTEAYVTPELGANLMFGIQLAKWVRLGLTASLGVGVELRPGGWGGLVDLNHHLVQALLTSNPPADAPCTPIFSEKTSQVCSNTFWGEDSQGTYACSTDGVSSCCMKFGDVTLCVEDWTGLDKSTCDLLNTVSGDPDKTAEVVAKISEYVGPKVTAAIEEAVALGAQVSSTWGEGKTCAESTCTPTIPVPSLDSLSTCEAHGYCANESGEILGHDVTEAQCLGLGAQGQRLGRCCSDYSPAAGGYASVTCGMTEEACEAQGITLPDGTFLSTGVFVPGGVCTDAVDRATCANPDDDKLGTSGNIFTPYQCATQVTPEVTGWEGDGCHPLNQGFASACGCAEDADCVSGETCGADGVCAGTSGYACLCDPADTSSCVAGRTCVEGACMKECAVDDECKGGFECASGVCRPKHGIATAEQLVWATQNPTSPLHAVSTYALSDLLVLAYMTFGLDIGLQLKLFGKTFSVSVLDLQKVKDLGSTNKSWYQAGLEARYESECVAPDDQLVSNRMPAPLTTDYGLDIPTAGLFSGYVDRYPDPGNTSLDPMLDGNACHPTGDTSACTWEDLVGWCEQELGENVFNPPAPEPGDLTSALTDTLDFGEDVGLQMWQLGQVCIDGQPWHAWAQNQGGSLEGLACVYTDPNTGALTTFPCGEAPVALLAAWGCLDVGLGTWSAAFAMDHPVVVSGSQINAAAVLVDPAGEFALTNFQPSYLFSGLMPTGILWMQEVEACFESKLDEASTCACAVDADCPGASDTCNADGVCVEPGGALAECSPIALANPPEPELCCGDGEVQAGEECDDGNDVAGDGCSTYCTKEQPPAPQRGACCEVGPAGAPMCVDTPSEAACQKNPTSTFHPGQSCATFACPRR